MELEDLNFDELEEIYLLYNDLQKIEINPDRLEKVFKLTPYYIEGVPDRAKKMSIKKLVINFWNYFKEVDEGLPLWQSDIFEETQAQKREQEYLKSEIIYDFDRQYEFYRSNGFNHEQALEQTYDLISEDKHDKITIILKPNEDHYGMPPKEFFQARCSEWDKKQLELQEEFQVQMELERQQIELERKNEEIQRNREAHDKKTQKQGNSPKKNEKVSKARKTTKTIKK
jgi:hypothetical protein